MLQSHGTVLPLILVRPLRPTLRANSFDLVTPHGGQPTWFHLAKQEWNAKQIYIYFFFVCPPFVKQEITTLESKGIQILVFSTLSKHVGRKFQKPCKWETQLPKSRGMRHVPSFGEVWRNTAVASTLKLSGLILGGLVQGFDAILPWLYVRIGTYGPCRFF